MTTAAHTTNRIAHVPFWRDTEEHFPRPALAATRQSDICIVGGGFTGLWTAHYLLKADPSLTVTIVESEYAGAGASGHGDGFVTPAIGHNLQSFIRAFGPETAKLAYLVVAKSIVEIQAFCRRHDIDAEIEPTGYLTVATTSRQLHRLEADLESMKQIGIEKVPTIMDRAQIRDRVASEVLIGGIHNGGALVNPFRLARGLARVVTGQGADLYEGSPVQSVEKGRTRFTVRTPGGAIDAGQVVFATNASQHQFRPFRSMIRPMWSYALVTEELTDRQLDSLGWPGREGIVEAREIIAFARLTKTNRILVGGGPVAYHYGRDMSDKHIDSRRHHAILAGLLGKYFPQLGKIAITHSYGGCMDMTPDLVPHIGRLPTGELYSHGYCGNGVAYTNTVGKVMRDLLLDKQSSLTKLAFVGAQQRSYPSEPIAWMQTRMHNRSLDRADGGW